MLRRRSTPVLVAASALLAPEVARAFPDRPVRVVIPFAPGGNADTLIRLLAPRLQEALGQPVAVDNRPGGGGAIGASVVAQSQPDGHTLFFDSFNFVVTPILAPRGTLAVDYERAFAPIGNAVTAPYVIAVRRGFTAQSLPALVEHVRRNPGLPFGTPGTGTVGHLAGALIGARANIRLEHLPYRSGAEAARDLAGGQLDLALITASSLRPVVEDGRALPIAVTGAERRGGSGPFAQVPTVAEQGFPGFELTSWNGLFAPAATPAAVLARLEAALRDAVADEAVQRRIVPTGNEPSWEGAAGFRARIARDRETVRRVVAEAGITAG